MDFGPEKQSSVVMELGKSVRKQSQPENDILPTTALTKPLPYVYTIHTHIQWTRKLFWRSLWWKKHNMVNIRPLRHSCVFFCLGGGHPSLSKQVESILVVIPHFAHWAKMPIKDKKFWPLKLGATNTRKIPKIGGHFPFADGGDGWKKHSTCKFCYDQAINFQGVFCGNSIETVAHRTIGILICLGWSYVYSIHIYVSSHIYIYMYINIVFKCILYICIYLSLFLHILACTCIYIYMFTVVQLPMEVALPIGWL